MTRARKAATTGGVTTRPDYKEKKIPDLKKKKKATTKRKSRATSPGPVKKRSR